ncbi:site-specific integrase [Dysgonomonas termitidis]|uniref:Site-specific integrase n=1 Tax=Dysgonomonas termitidis TaxID=1516126 RepID=A0ABV9KZW7_9BACT
MKATLKVIQRLSHEAKDGTCPVCLRYTSYRRVTYIGLNISVHPKHWSDNKKMVLASHRDHLLYNRIIQEQYTKAQTIIRDHFIKPLRVGVFLNKFKDKLYGNTDFYVFAENELRFLELTRAKRTIANYRNFLNKMQKWKPVLTFDAITLDYIKKFHEYEIQSGNLLNTIYKKHSNFKFFLGIAVDKGILDKNPYSKFKIKKITQAQNNDILNEDELKILQKAYDLGKYKGGRREVLRGFLFSCYTSLSYAEFYNVTYDDLKPVVLKEDKNDDICLLLSNNRLKTGVKYKIPIVSSVVESLLERKNKKTYLPIFYPLSNWRTNQHLKEIIAELSINKTITFHRARHTFRTIAAKRGIRDGIAERIMGHAIGNNIQDIYMHLDDEDIVAEMKAKWIVAP